MTLLGKLRAAASAWPWFARDVPTLPAEPGFENDPFFSQHRAHVKNRRLKELADEQVKIRLLIDKAKAQKTRRRHLYAALSDCQNERLRVESGE